MFSNAEGAVPRGDRVDPAIELARSMGMSEKQLRQAEAIIKEHGDEFRAAWHRYFDG